MSAADQDLVQRCRLGDRDAFSQIVQRYQNLVCSIAYSSTGNVSVSEELAQETFLTAWRSLERLRRPERLRAWLCGIVRNLVRKSARRSSRDVLKTAAAIDRVDVPASACSDPVEATITRDEAALMDRTLESIPATYREPLVLYYREEQSVARVAYLLGLSENAVKQRLARGRKLLRNEIAATIERGLRQSAPSRAFTLGVLAALPVMSGTAKAATLTATGAKGVSAMNAAGWMGMLGAIVGPVAGIAGAWFGVKMSLKAARSERERAFIIKSTWWMFGLITIFTIGLTGLLLLGRDIARQNPTGFAIAIIGLVGGYVIALLVGIFYGNRCMAQIRREEGTLEMSPAEVAAKFPKSMRRWQYPAVYESRFRLLGLPLLAIRFNGVVGDPRQFKPAVGWIAIGDKAYGLLLACGAIAVGGVAFGGVGIGVLSFAGLALGIVPFGGGAAGGMAMGGIAVGLLAYGGCALAWQAAFGGLAVSREIAVGGLAVAENANNEVARQFVADHGFFRLSDLLATHAWFWLVGLGILFGAMLWARRKAERMARQ